MQQVFKQELIRAAFEGMQMAERSFSALTSNSVHFNCAPEYLMTVNIAEKLGKTAPNHLTWLEYKLRHARSDIRTGEGDPKPVLNRARCDILMCWAYSKEPRAAFEIKRDVQSLSKIKRDVERILYLMGEGCDGNTLQFGAVMFNTMAESLHGKKVIRDRVAQFHDQLADWRDGFDDKKHRLNIIAGEIKKRRAGDHWAPLALVAERVR